MLRVTLPLGMSIQPGTRVIVNDGQPMTGPYIICFNNGCMADYEASGELIGNLKKGQGLVIQGINGVGRPLSLVVPFGELAKAYDGPPTDPKVFEEQQKKLQEELQRRAEEARQEARGPTTAIAKPIAPNFRLKAAPPPPGHHHIELRLLSFENAGACAMRPAQIAVR